MQLPTTVTAGASSTLLHWDTQGRSVIAMVMFTTNVPAVRFGFLLGYKVETGTLDIDGTTFSDVGEYNIALIRLLEYRTADASQQFHLSWASTTPQRVQVIPPPVI